MRAPLGIIMFVALAAAGCASTSSMKSEPLDAGTSRTYSASLADAVNASKEAVAAAQLFVMDSTRPDANTASIVARANMSALSAGEYVRVVVQKTGERNVVVRVLTKKVMKTNVAAKGDYSGQIFAYLDKKLKRGS
jgi:uncharacterized protein (DUF2252 family)